MNPVISTIYRQFDALAPRTLTHGGRSYTRAAAVYSNEDGSVRFDFTARKRRGAFVADKLSICVRYLSGRDLYLVGVLHFDGATFDATQIASLDGLQFDAFEDVQGWIDRAA